jgi:dTDP-4-amino-4,6-dideoxygalactose transaminase
MDPILEIAERRGIPVIEDAAQAIGAEYKGRRSGSIGDMGCFSFFPSKNLGGYGDGGMITTDDEEKANLLVSLREHGQRLKDGGQTEMYHHWTIGLNSRLDAIQAAVLLVKLGHLDEWSDGRARNAEYYNARFDGSPVVTPYRAPSCRHIYNQYVVRVPDRDGLRSHLREIGIGCAVYYPVPLHMQECFSAVGQGEGDMPESERAAAETLSIPVFSLLAKEEMDAVATAILEYVGSR